MGSDAEAQGDAADVRAVFGTEGFYRHTATAGGCYYAAAERKCG
jgi:hypothetical protein